MSPHFTDGETEELKGPEARLHRASSKTPQAIILHHPSPTALICTQALPEPYRSRRGRWRLQWVTTPSSANESGGSVMLGLARPPRLPMKSGLCPKSPWRSTEGFWAGHCCGLIYVSEGRSGCWWGRGGEWEVSLLAAEGPAAGTRGWHWG